MSDPWENEGFGSAFGAENDWGEGESVEAEVEDELFDSAESDEVDPLEDEPDEPDDE